MLACGEKDVRGAERFTVVEAYGPVVAVTDEGLDGDAADDGAFFGGTSEEGLIERATGERQRLKGKWGRDNCVAGRQPDIVDGLCAESERIDAGPIEIVDGFAAEEFPADFVVSRCLSFNEHDPTSCGGETDCEQGAGGPSTDNQNIAT
jgi:hypothetical protein